MNSNDYSKAISNLDLDPIKFKLMHVESGQGWSLEKANAVETEYRRFLILMKMFPHEQTAPLVDVDTFWHYHILDTMKYAADCEQVFGYFLHHYPYVGMQAGDEQSREQGSDRMRELYEDTFGESYLRGAEQIATADAAYCGAAIDKAAYCGAAIDKAAYCGAATAKAAYCGAANSKTAYCGAAIDKAAYCGAATAKAAYCGAAIAKTAYCGAATPKAAYCGAATPKAAYCGAATAKTAYCGAATAKTAYCGAATAQAAYCGAASTPPLPAPTLAAA